MAVGLLALIAAAACVPKPEPVQPGSTAATAASPQPLTTVTPDTNTPPTTPAPPTPAATERPTGSESAALSWKNVVASGDVSSSSGDVSSSSGEESARLAVDGDLDSVWNSNRMPLGWFMITLDGLYLVDRVEMVVAQTPAGPTTHEAWLGDSSGTRTLYERLINVHTEDGQTLHVDIQPPRRVNEVLIRTVDSPNWVAWREVRVYGAPSVNPVEEGGAA